MKRLLLVLLAVVLATTLVVVPAQAKKKKGFKTGTYTATLQYSSSDGTFGNTTFKFKVYKGVCYKQKSGSLVKVNGYCLSGKGPTPSIPLDCPDVPDGPADTTGFVFMPNQAWISPKTGKFHISFRNQTHGEDWEQLTTNIKLKRNGKASGDFQITEQISSVKATSVCNSKQYSFTAKR